jgi:hypothetical protein
MLQTLFQNKKQGFSCEVTIPADLQAELDALSARLVYLAEMGWKQSLSDGIAGVDTQDAFTAKVMKKYDAVIAGTVRVAGSGDRQPTKSPIEREVWAIAAKDLAKLFAKLKVPKEKQAVYIRMKVTRDWDELEPRARANIEQMDAMKPGTFAALDELYAMAEEAEETPTPEVEVPKAEETPKVPKHKKAA